MATVDDRTLPESFAEELAEAVYAGDVAAGPVETAADLVFEVHYQRSIAASPCKDEGERHRAADAFGLAYARLEAAIRSLGGRWVLVSAPSPWIVRWDEAAGGLQWAKPERAGMIVTSRPGGMAVAV
jgi:hypothetical protein